MTAQAQYTPDQIKQAARNAYANKDYAGAQRLDALYQKSLTMQPQQQTRPEVPESERDNAFQYGIDQMQSLTGSAVEGIGKFVGSEGMQKYGQKVQAKNAEDMAKGGYQFKYDSYRDAFEKDGLAGALSHSGSAVAAGLPTTGATLVGGAATYGAAVLSAPAWVVAGLGGLTTATGVGLGIGENVQEQKEKLGGDFDENVALGVGAVVGLLDRIGVGKVFKTKELKNMSPQQIADRLNSQGMGDKAKEFLKGMGVEALTEATQEGVQMAATAAQGGQYTGQEVGDRLFDAGITGGLTAGTIKGTTGAVTGAANMVGGNKPDLDTPEGQAKASFAQRLRDKAEANDYDLKIVDRSSTDGARAAVDSVHKDMAGDLKQLFKDLKERLAVTDRDSIEEVADKVMAQVGYEKARNKTKNKVDQENFDAIEKLVGDTQEGQRILGLLREMNEMTDIHNSGYKGGVSAITDQFGLYGIGGEAGYDQGRATAEYVLRPMTSMVTGVSTGGASTAAQLGVVGTGRAIDKVTGRRSKVQRYVDQNADQTGLPPAAGPSLRELRRQEILAAEEKEEQDKIARQEMNQEAFDSGLPPTDTSPQGKLQSILGVDQNTLVSLLESIVQNRTRNPLIITAANDALTSMQTGGRVENLTGLVRVLKDMVNPDPDFWIERHQQLQGAANAQKSQREINYERGVNANRVFVDKLMDQLNGDTSVQPLDKAKILAALDNLKGNLGSDPIGNLNATVRQLAEAGVDQESLQNFFIPYVERVVAQQEAATQKRQLDAEDDLQVQESQAALDDSREVQLDFETVEQRKQRAEEQGFDTSTVYYHGTYADINDRQAYDSFENPNKMGGLNRVGTWLDTSPENYSYLDGRANDTVYPVYIRKGKAWNIEARVADSSDPFNQLEKQIADDMDMDAEPWIQPTSENNAKIDEWADKLKGMGYTHINLIDTKIDEMLTDGKPRTFTIVLDPSNIRSVNAQFDPAKTDSANLSDSRNVTIDINEVSQPANPDSGKTQRGNTLETARKSLAYLNSRNPDGDKTLDFGAGYGTNAESLGIEQTYEPFADGWQPTYNDPNAIPSNTFDKIISTNVMNVIRPAERAESIYTLGRALKVGGEAVIQVRDNNDVSSLSKSKKAVAQSEPSSFVTGENTYQKGFTPDELLAEVQDVLGPNFTVEKIPAALKINGTKVLVKKVADTQQQFDNSAQPDAISLDLGDMGSNPMRVSPSYPQGKKIQLDPLTQNLQIGLESIKANPEIVGKHAVALRQYMPLDDTSSSDLDFLEQAIEFVKGNLLSLYDSVSPEYRERAKLWYVGANKLAQQAAEQYNLPLESVAGVFAALSPQQDWYVNYDIGMRAIDIYFNQQDTVFDETLHKNFRTWINRKHKSGKDKGKFERDTKARKNFNANADEMLGKPFKDLTRIQQAYYVRFFDEANFEERGHKVITPEGGFSGWASKQDGNKITKKWNSFPPIEKALEMLQDPSKENLHVQLGNMHKVRSFYNNILDPFAAEGDVTIDTHAVAAGLLRPLAGSHKEVKDNFGSAGSSKVAGVFGSYGVYAEAYRRAAAEAGVLPREMQSITWEAVRGLFPKTAKGKKQQAKFKTIWSDYKNGKISLSEARGKVYETAGNIRPAQWENDRRNFGFNPSPRPETNASIVPRLSASRGDGRRSGSDATGVLPQPTQEVNQGPILEDQQEIDYTDIMKFVKPTPKQIKDNLPEAEAIVDGVVNIGKKGTRFENGVSTIEDMLKIADLMDITVHMYDDAETYYKESDDIQKNTSGRHSDTGPQTSEIWVQGPEIQGELEALTSLVHESMHSAEKRPPPESEELIASNITGASPSLLRAQYSHRGAGEGSASFRAGSLRQKLGEVVFAAQEYKNKNSGLSAAGYGDKLVHGNVYDGRELNITYKQAAKIKREIEKLQVMEVSLPNRPELGSTTLRTTEDRMLMKTIKRSFEQFGNGDPDNITENDISTYREMFGKQIKSALRPYRRYTREDAEFAVDPLILYFIDPKTMKKVAPETAKFIRDHFNPTKIPLKFHAHPMVAIMAILLAGYQGDEDEEMEQGVLSPQPALLSV